MSENSFTEEIKYKNSIKENDNVGYPALCERLLNEKLTKYNKSIKLDANNILAIEYVKALKAIKSILKIHTVKREGGAYSEEKIVEGNRQSATAIRNLLSENDISALDYIPFSTRSVILDAIKNNSGPCIYERLDVAIITHFRLIPARQEDFSEADVGLYNRLKAASFEANTIQALVKLTATKKYTASRVKRAILHSLLGVTSSELKMPPLYTQVLAMDDVGRALLKSFG